MWMYLFRKKKWATYAERKQNGILDTEAVDFSLGPELSFYDFDF